MGSDPVMMPEKRIKGIRGWLLLAGVFAAGVTVGMFAAGRLPCLAKRPVIHLHRTLRLSGYRYVNPLLECEIYQDQLDNHELEPFKYKVERLIKERVAKGDAQTVSVYFRNLNDGPWFGINSREKFSPASLMKVPVMIGWLKKAESDPRLLKKTLVYDDGEDWNEQQNIKPSIAIVQGKGYTVEDLIFRMMAYSDNNAWHLLFKNIDVAYLDHILADLDVNYDPDKDEDFMTVKAYSSFYRVLYNASYLSREMSEKALAYLALEDFKDGILAGVPAGVDVASKFGERTLGANREIKQLHEFGIVYFPKNPYLLGVMTRGADFSRLTGVIRDISRLVYEEVDRSAKVK